MVKVDKQMIKANALQLYIKQHQDHAAYMLRLGDGMQAMVHSTLADEASTMLGKVLKGGDWDE